MDKVIKELLEYVEGKFEGPFEVIADERYVEIYDSENRCVASKAV